MHVTNTMCFCLYSANVASSWDPTTTYVRPCTLTLNLSIACLYIGAWQMAQTRVSNAVCFHVPQPFQTHKRTKSTRQIRMHLMMVILHEHMVQWHPGEKWTSSLFHINIIYFLFHRKFWFVLCWLEYLVKMLTRVGLVKHGGCLVKLEDLVYSMVNPVGSNKIKFHHKCLLVAAAHLKE